MKKTRFTESQIVKALKEHEAGPKAEDICRELENSRAAFYKWKSRYGGMEASDVQRLIEGEEENQRLKKMFADLSLDHAILKEVIDPILTHVCGSKKAGALAAESLS
ncbi:transposase [Adhaeribacter soli]|uniref:Transposase n=1 Tax=Adhaeribacter soli TaxID=2607655 RepID=A0A5N1IJW4_9BACT|nr:transposase [Adhaeribacter soli]KAA9325708.1 transposase [Adhaeribacter soli]